MTYAARVFIVDDEKDVLDALEKRLQINGYKVEKACSGRDALARIPDAMPDIILLDILMPDINGLEVKKQLNKNIDTMAIPVIFLTAKGHTSDKVQGLTVGADDYVTKPYNAEELLARIKSVIERRKFYEQVSMTDGLTGVFNVYYFKKQISLFFNLAKRHLKIFALAMLDIDDFKRINDSFGHLGGDAVLRTTASIMTQTLRETDIITRYGGDEFAIILPESTYESACQAISRIEQEIAASACRNESGKPIKFTVSTGTVVYDPSFTSEAHMFAAADEALYRAKRVKKM